MSEAASATVAEDAARWQPILRRLAELGPALIGIAVFLWWTALQGGFVPTRFYPGGLLILGALVVLLVARPERLAASAPLLRASLAFGALFALVALAGVAWADARADALDGGHRTLVYVACFALFALTPLRPRAAALLMGAWALGVAAIGFATLVRAALGDDVDAFFQANRLSQPIGYINATCALLLMAFWPALVLASRRELPVLARGVLSGAALVLVDLAIITQTRSSALAVPVVAAASFVLVPGRVRQLLALAPIAVAVLVTLGPLLDLFDELDRGAEQDALRDVAVVIGVSAIAVTAAAILLAWVDRRVTISQRTARRADLAFVAVAAVLLVAGTAGALAKYGDPVGRAQDAWDEFTSGDRPKEFEGTRFAVGGLGDYRSDYWRVALRQFADAPLLGVGVDNFGAAYIRERRYNEARFPHSTQLAILSGTGIVGSLLFVAFVGCAVAAYLRARRGDALAAAVGAAGILAFLYWFVHGVVDWLWEIPALGAPAFALLGAAAAVSGGPRRVSARVGRVGYAAAGALVVAAVVAVPPWLAARQVEAATVGWRQQPETAIEGLERAAALNPLSEQPYLLAGVVANRTGRPGRARALLLDARQRNRVNWYVHYELAIAEAAIGRRDAALAALRRAEEQNPREPTIEQVREWIVAGEPVDTRELDAEFRARVDTLVTEAQDD